MTAITVAVVDDHPIVRDALRAFLSCQEGICVIGEAATAAAAIELVQHASPDVMVLDLDLPNCSGIDALAPLRKLRRRMAVLIFSAYSEEHYGIRLLRQGAGAFLNKSCALDELVTAIRALAAGRRYVTPALAQLLANDIDPDRRVSHPDLTDREWQVLLKLARGLDTGTIAAQISLSSDTVSMYRRRILDKLELASNADIAYYALKHNLLF